MGSCSSVGVTKRQHTKALARMHASKLNRNPNKLHDVVPYKCPRCHFWHVGKLPPRMERQNLVRWQTAVDDRLVGRLIQALTNTIGRKPPTPTEES